MTDAWPPGKVPYVARGVAPFRFRYFNCEFNYGGWEPFRTTYWGLEKVRLDPASDWAWNGFGKRIYRVVDILNPSVYCFYWTPDNVAYTLADIDLNRKLVNSMPVRKPIRPCYWTLLHGGGGGERWRKNQPLPDEDVRAMIAMRFFTEFDGFDTWNWSGIGNHHRVTLPPATQEKWHPVNFIVGRPFSCADENGRVRQFVRYDAIHVESLDPKTNEARFQVIEKDRFREKYGLTPDRPHYRMDAARLCSFLRPKSEPVAAMIEGMALVRPLEYILRNGEVKIDVSAQEQFARRLPIVRRVAFGPVHVLITYDPNVVYGTAPKDEKAPPPHGRLRRVVLDVFDGVKGRTITLPADANTRIFILLEARGR